jgi:hypothetical protein
MFFVGDFRILQCLGKTGFFTVVLGTVPEVRAANAGRAVAANDLAVGVLTLHVVDIRSWVMITSPSMPTTSVTWVMRREPSRRRAAWMITSMEPTMISLTVF